MNRRRFLKTAGTLSAGCLIAKGAAEAPWRTFEVRTRVALLEYPGPARLWIPTPLTSASPFQRTLSTQIDGAPTGGTARIVKTKDIDGLGIVAAEFSAGAQPALTVISQVATRDYAIDLSKPGSAPKLPPAELNYFRRSTKLLPTDGIVGATAAAITTGAKTDLEKASAIYEWIVDNTFRDPKTRGCGIGDIRFMLESGDLGGKCADLNALYVGLARAAGLPARDAYGIRLAGSKLGYKSLGTSSETVSKAQHCRAEVFIESHGWVPVDPADVRKVALEEPPGNRPVTDDMVERARARLFGSWEMNWMAYNFAHDVALPGSAGAPVGFLMYPQAETAGGRLDSLDPDHFKYEITAREITEPKA